MAASQSISERNGDIHEWLSAKWSEPKWRTEKIAKKTLCIGGGRGRHRRCRRRDGESQRQDSTEGEMKKQRNEKHSPGGCSAIIIVEHTAEQQNYR